MKLLPKISLIIFLFISLGVTAQNAVDFYNSAKTALERGDVEIGLRHLNSCQNLLGGSNAKIESLRFQAYYQKGDLLNAAASFRNYDSFLSPELKTTKSYSELNQLHKSVWEELNAERKKEEERKKKEIEQDLSQTNASVESFQQQLKSKIELQAEKNAKKLAEIAVSNKDSALMVLYKTHYTSAGYRDKTVDLELDKRVNPIKYKRLAEIDQLIKDVNYNFNRGMEGYAKYQYFHICDSLATHLLNNYKESEFESGVRKKMGDLSSESRERYKWNKEYFEKYDLLKQHDELDIKIGNMDENYSEEAYLYGGWILGGGTGFAVAAGVTYLMDGNKSDLKYVTIGAGVAGVGVAILLTGWISKKIFIAKYRKAKRKLYRMKDQIGPVLDKRKEKINGKPLVLIN